MTTAENSLLSFLIGPVQPFIEAARSLRDLWSGSYLISWLTASAMREILDDRACGPRAFVTPHVTADHPILAAQSGRLRSDPRSTLPSLPNRFAAIVPRERAEDIARRCEEDCKKAWLLICDRVKRELESVVNHSDGYPDWSRNWDAQVDDFFEIRCVHQPIDGDVSDSRAWAQVWRRIGERMEASRSVRHVPKYLPAPAPD